MIALPMHLHNYSLMIIDIYYKKKEMQNTIKAYFSWFYLNIPGYYVLYYILYYIYQNIM